jgi:hypothetical protein
MKLLWLPVLLLLALLGCANQNQALDDSPQGRCRRQVANDPAIKNIRMKQASEWALQVTLQKDLQDTTNNLMQQCLLMYGIGVEGGVQGPAPFKGTSAPIGH